MSEPTFLQKLNEARTRNDSLLCVGIDPDPSKIPDAFAEEEPERGVFGWCRKIADATAPYACAFKPNAAFFAAKNNELDLAHFCWHVKNVLKIPLILDAKRGDIGNTAEKYAEEAFVRFAADAVTVNPYMGRDTIEPFLKHEGKGVIVLCRTSNPGGGDFQDLVVEDGLKLYEYVAFKMSELDARYGGGRIALVVGATRPEELARVRSIVGDMPLLVPGVGAQGGDVEATVRAGQTKDGNGIVINSSRGIIYAADPAEAARETRDLINRYRHRSA